MSGNGGGGANGERAVEVVGAPWYVQFWPVAIALLMAVSIAASLATVVIAHRHADEEVRVSTATGPDEPIR